MIVRASIIVTGIVQGVFFRHNTKLQAGRLALKGTVRNMPDGTVAVVCEGEEEAVRGLIEWCRKGPRGALVDRVDVEWEAPSEAFPAFSIIY